MVKIPSNWNGVQKKIFVRISFIWPLLFMGPGRDISFKTPS
jgi:hypothetical protein